MRFLLDTHVWLWLQSDPSRIAPELLDRLEQADRILLSAASAWEIGIKSALGKLNLPEPPSVYVTSRMSKSGTDSLPVEILHALEAASLPSHHRDPFDRVLIAQSRLLRIPLVSSDRTIASYDVDVVWV